jgi:hypothetical protein
VQKCDPCVEGLTGNLCTLCADGWFRALEECHKCPSEGAVTAVDFVLTIGLILLVIVFWITINYTLACKFDAMELTLLYLQCVALALNYNVNWPTKIQVIKHWVSIFNFEVRLEPRTTHSTARTRARSVAYFSAPCCTSPTGLARTTVLLILAVVAPMPERSVVRWQPRLSLIRREA